MTATPATDKEIALLTAKLGGYTGGNATLSAEGFASGCARLTARIEAQKQEIAALKADVDWMRMGRDECRLDRERLTAEVAAMKADIASRKWIDP